MSSNKQRQSTEGFV